MASKDSTVKAVQLDGQVVLKIVQHCNDSLPQLVTGQLLGLDVGHTLEVTDSFPFPVRHQQPRLSLMPFESGGQHQHAVTEALAMVQHRCSNKVGWLAHA